MVYRLRVRHGAEGGGFRPSSPLCPLAVHVALGLRDAMATLPGVTPQEVEVAGDVGAAELTAWLRELS